MCNRYASEAAAQDVSELKMARAIMITEVAEIRRELGLNPYDGTARAWAFAQKEDTCLTPLMSASPSLSN